MGSIAEILWPSLVQDSGGLDDPRLPSHQRTEQNLVTEINGAEACSTAGALLKQFEGNMSDVQSA